MPSALGKLSIIHGGLYHQAQGPLDLTKLYVWLGQPIQVTQRVHRSDNRLHVVRRPDQHGVVTVQSVEDGRQLLGGVDEVEGFHELLNRKLLERAMSLLELDRTPCE